MKSEQWAVVKEILYEALERPCDARREYVLQACGTQPELAEEVFSLLRAQDENSGFLTVHPPAEIVQIPDLEPGDRIGPYRIVEEIGRGGMGSVYLAERDDGIYEQQVAIKLVKRGMDTDFVLQRFRYERQLLAFLSHPYIARLLEGGTTTDGRPYFVMEFVPGRPILQYCHEERVDLQGRIRIFRQVCEAVDHAHRNLIVHRDLKPANILITEDGVPRLLDFGIATLMLPDAPEMAAARTGETRMLTPDYGSPEQFRGEPVTTAADVYSLGTVLYELLTGVKAHRFQSKVHSELERVICHEDPIKPSDAIVDEIVHATLQPKALRGDLDRIVLKALHKEPARRYSSVEQLSEDLRRYVEGRPVLAQPDSLSYRWRKFASRNKASVAAGALAVVCLVVGVITTAWQAHVAGIQRDRAERRFQDVRRLASSFLVENDILATLPGGTGIRGKLIQRSLEYLDGLAKEAAGDLSLQQELAMAYEKMGDVQGRADGPNVGDTAAALTSYRKALAIRESMQAAAPANVDNQRHLAVSLSRMSGVMKIAGEYRAGLEFDRRALAIRERLLAADPSNRSLRREAAASYTTLGGSLFQVGEWAGVLPARKRALELYTALAQEEGAASEDWRGLALAQLRMGSILRHSKEATESERHYLAAMEAARTGLKTWPNNLGLRQMEASAASGLGSLQLDQGRAEAAVRSYRTAQAIYEDLGRADPDDVRLRSLTATEHFHIARALLRQRQAPHAMAEFSQSLVLRESVAAGNPLNAGAKGEVAESLAGLGDTYAALGKRSEAMLWYGRALTVLDGLKRQNRANSASLTELARVQAEMAKLTANGR
ncbi:serine/threonine-protein kinase [uncultured Paludibaculum sp.]|uniref:serine/threonine-protein kinase n=1 Tax=uncultured Paludibaculum sp. TaxID=1765020 RepID=UPI002AAC434E|nr:serine/threonine-protein kinase [uncultured Paludibaculum sp.]